MSLSKHLHLASFTTVFSLVLATTLVSCGDGNDDAGDSESGGSNSGGSNSGGSNSGGSDSGGSGTGGESSSGGDAGTGGQVGDGPFVGDACTDNSECPMLGEFAGSCRTIWPGGYCSGTCNRSEDCGPGNVCLTAGWCVKACEDDSECREEYRCYDDLGTCEPGL
jgi:hypothetical protein